MKDRSRIAIIGGGVAGCSLAYHLSELGWNDVVLIEKGELTSGSTWHAAGLCTQFNPSLHLSKLLMRSLDLYRDLQARTGQAVDLHQVGSIRLASTTDRLDEYRRGRSKARAIGLPFEVIDLDEIQERCPIVNLDGVLGAAWIPTDGHIDPSAVANALAAGAQARGVEIAKNTQVTALRPQPGGGWIVETDTGDLECEIVVNAAGMWAPRIGAMAGVELPIVPLEHEFVVTGPIPEVAQLEREIPVMRDPEASFYVRAEGDGLIVGPFERHTKAWSVDGVPWDFEGKLLQPDLDRIQDILLLAAERFPAFADASIGRVVNGPDGYTPDGHCLMGWVPGARNLFVLAGFSIFGIVFAGGAGGYAAEWIVDGQPSDDMWEVDVRRFGPWAATSPFLVDRSLDVYAHEYAIHYPNEERPAGRPLMTDPLYERLRQRGAVFGFRSGWERPLWFAPDGVEPREVLTFRRPNWYEHVAAECVAVRERVGVLDQTSFAKYEVSGPGAEGFLDRLCANRLPPQGRITVTQMLTARGGIECDLTVTRLADDRFYVVSAAATQTHDLAWMQRHLRPEDHAVIEDVTEATGVLTIAGPLSRDLLASLSADDVSNASFPWMTARTIRVGDVPVLAMRLSYVGELGWELHHPIEHLEELYAGLMGAGTPLGIVDFGYRALDSLRMEKAYRLWGADMSADRTPFEAGLERFVALDKGDFIGREALIAQRDEGIVERLACLVLDVEDAIAHGGESISTPEGRVVGYVSACEHGHVVGQTIALAYLPIDLSVPGTSLEVDILGTPRRASVVGSSLYDPTNERPRS